jgi:hypothetical protein
MRGAVIGYNLVQFVLREKKPRDKAKVEVAVQVAQRWILARLRNETFFSLESLNERIAEPLEDLNDRPMKKLGGMSRRALFDRVERTALLPLPAQRFELSEWRRATVNVDYHVASSNTSTRCRTRWCARRSRRG